MEKQWVLEPNKNPAVVEHLAKALDIDSVLASLLEKRGVTNFDEAKTFFRPALTDLLDPFLMKDMRKAIDLIDDVMRNHKPILIYGDYDVDGTTAVAYLYLYLSKYYDKLAYYVPDRQKEGYGVSVQAIDWAVEQGFKLIITLDCGVTAIEQVKYANDKGLQIIISDHHLPAEELPEAAAILNPKQLDCPYPYKELSGCGIGFKIASAFAQHHQLDTKPLFQHIDLVAVAIASDIVPITGENRILAHFGLKKLNEDPTIGLRAIIDLACPDKPQLAISDIVFSIGPRINAAGRMGDARKAVNLLIANEQPDAALKAGLIDNTNMKRRDVDASITQEALALISSIPDFENRKSTVVYGAHWHKGVIGIVASRLIEHYHRPTIVFTQQDDVYTGSARSVNGFNIYDAISACNGLVEQFGGHKFAAGLTVKAQNIDAFCNRFEEIVNSRVHAETFTPRIEIDNKLHFSQITPKFFRILKQFAPFGPGNMHPVFMSEGVFAAGYMRVVGENHLHLALQQPDTTSFMSIGFNLGHNFNLIAKGVPFNMCYTIEENIWKGKTSIKLNIKDIKF